MFQSGHLNICAKLKKLEATSDIKNIQKMPTCKITLTSYTGKNTKLIFKDILRTGQNNNNNN